MSICLIPGVSDLYEVTVLTESPDELVIETFHMVGPDRRSAERRRWERMLNSRTAHNQRVRAVAALPKTLAPIAQEVQLVSRTRAPLAGPGASDGLMENPSMVSTLRKERAKYGGYTGPLESEGHNAYVIFGGRYFGGYLFLGGPKIVRLTMAKVLLENSGPRAFGIIMKELINRILAPAFPEHSFAVKRYPRLDTRGLPTGMGGQLTLWQDGTPVDSDFFTLWMLMIQMVEYAEVSDPVAALREVYTLTAELFQKLTQRSRQGTMRSDSIHLDVLRWLSIPKMSPRERHVYAKTWLRTQSPNKALKAVFPNVRGKAASIEKVMDRLSDITAREISVGQAKRLLNFSPYSAKDLINLYDKKGPFNPLYSGARLLTIGVEGRAQRVGFRLTATELRDLVFKKKFSQRDVDLLFDTFKTVRENEMDFPQTREGLLYMQHVRERKWRQVLRDHDGVMELSERYRQERRNRESAARRATLKETRGITSQMEFYPGITPLLTDADFEQEKNEMRHCIMGYARSPHYHNFHIKHPITGDESTLQLNLIGKIEQHYGHYNASVSPTQDEYAREFVEMNRDLGNFILPGA